MVNAPIITKRELSNYFLSPIAYVVLTAFALAQAVWLMRMVGGGELGDLDTSLQDVLRWPFMLLMLLTPVFTMGLLSEEARSGTLESLMTTRTSEWELVIGKFIGALVFALIMLGPLVAQVLWLASMGNPDVGALLAAAVGLLLLTAQMVAVGLLCSALTRIQIVAAIAGVVTLVAASSLRYMPLPAHSTLGVLLRYAAPDGHYISFVRGTVDTRGLVYFVATTAGLLLLTVRALQVRKIGGTLGLRRIGESAHILIVTGLALALIVLGAYISTRSYARMDWTRRRLGRVGQRGLQKPTLKLLRDMDRNVDITVLYTKDCTPAEYARAQFWMAAITPVLEELQAHNARISVRTIEGSRQTDERNALLARLGRPNMADVCAVFESRDTHAVVHMDGTFGPSSEDKADDGTTRVFMLAEEQFARALQRITKPQASVAYVVGNINLNPPRDRNDSTQNRYARLAGVLKAERFDVQRLKKLSGAVPGDCGVLLLATGHDDLTLDQAEALREYLDQRNGAAILLVPPHESGTPPEEAGTPVLDALTRGYGIGVRRDAVVVTPGQIDAPAVRAMLVPTMDKHTVGADLHNARPVLQEASPLEMVKTGRLSQPRVLLVGAEYHWGETGFERPAAFDPERDVVPPFALVALTDPGRDTSTRRPRRGPRIAVFGSLRSLDDEWTMEHPANLHVLRSIVSWMSREDRVDNIKPRILATQVIKLNPASVKTTNIVFLAVLPACLVAMGLCVGLLRRR